MPITGLNLVILTIGLNYTLISMLESKGLGQIVDWDLVGVGPRSVFNLNSFLILLGVCCMVLTLEYMLNFLSDNNQMMNVCKRRKDETIIA